MTGLLLAGSAMLFLLGYWGRRNAEDLVPVSLHPDERARRTRVLRRGSMTCCVVATLFLIVGVVGAFP
ncbi:MAG: hypothetical protein JWQ60_2242 [Pseudonocardia sp.]|jgi:hypothetical protein|nr:hypothetical protein [Pseudonocardia sp.]